MKAVIVINYASEEDIGKKTFIHLLNEENKWYEDVVIRPLPESKDIGYPNDDYDVGFGDGWDACLKELEK